MQKCLEREIDRGMAFVIGGEGVEKGPRVICINSTPPGVCLPDPPGL